MEADLEELEATANVFIESTEGHLRKLEIITKRDYLQLAGLHEYFEAQLKDVRKLAIAMSKLPPEYEKARGVSQDSTAAINRLVSTWKTQIRVMRRLEGHCARMVGLTQKYFDRALLQASRELAAAVRDIVKSMARKTS